MNYNTIKPPFTLKLREMPKAELERYFLWFLDVIPARLSELAEAVTQTPGSETWRPDYTPASLDRLGEWFAGQVETRIRSQEEIQAIGKRSPFSKDISGVELTNRTFSLAMDIGMYLSQVLLNNHPSLKWEQPLGNKRFIYYGQPVLVRFSHGAFNPVHMVVTLACGLVTKVRGGGGLREIYDIWVKLIQPA